MKYDFDKVIKLNGFEGVGIQYKFLLGKIATFLFVETSHNTSTNNWDLTSDEIEETFSLEKGFIDDEIAKDIVKTLEYIYCDMAASIEFYNDEGIIHFDITLYDSFCCGFVQMDACLEEIK